MRVFSWPTVGLKNLEIGSSACALPAKAASANANTQQVAKKVNCLANLDIKVLLDNDFVFLFCLLVFLTPSGSSSSV
jgi:hypothetical protein